MSVSPDYLVDGNYLAPTTVGAPRLTYPFIENKDRVSAFFDQDFWQTIETWQPGDLSIRHSVALSDFYLVGETKPVQFMANLYGFQRTYSRVPVPQITYSTIPINKPSAAQVGGITGANFFFYSSVAPGTTLGTYTTYAGYVFGPNNKVYGPAQVTTSVNSGADTRITATAHGLTGTETIICAGAASSNVSYGIVAPAGYSVINANTIDILGFNLGAFAQSIAKYLRDYSGGIDRVTTKNITTFYLPGVTPGITTAEDIPTPSVAINDIDFMALIISGYTGYQTYDADPLALWMGQIYQQRVIQIDLSDV